MKVKACKIVRDSPGLKSRQIAQRLGIDKAELNRFLWSDAILTRGLIERNWRWYPSDYVQRPLGLEPRDNHAPEQGEHGVKHVVIAEHPKALCGILGGMDELAAIREIRRLDLLAIEKAFSEEGYPELSETLKIELIRRMEELKALEASRPTNSNGQQLLMRVLVIGVAAYGAVVLLAKLLEALSK